MTRVFISHSSSAGAQARAYIDALKAHLETAGAAYFLDEDDLRVGDVWRPIIYRELARCDGAVLVLDRTALSRPWVTKEATILAWRCALGAYGPARQAQLRLVAVLVDDVSKQEVEDAFPALHLDDLQLLRPASASIEDAREAAATTAGVFPARSVPERDPLQRWADRMTHWTDEWPDILLERLEEILSISDAPSVDADRRAAVVDAFLHRADFTQAVKALDESLGFHAPHVAHVVNAVLPVSVPAPSTAAFLRALREAPGSRVVALNACENSVGELFVQRATCCDSHVTVAIGPELVTAGPESLYRDVVARMGEKAGVIPPESLTPDDMRWVPQELVVLLRRRSGDGGLPLTTLEALLSRLRREFPTCIFLILSGETYDDIEGLVPPELRAHPALKPDDARGLWMNANRLRSRMREMSSA